jgi:hypothetical protein
MIHAMLFQQAATTFHTATTLTQATVANIALQTLRNVIQFPHKHVMGIIFLSVVTCGLLLGLIFGVKLLAEKLFPLPQ